MSVLDEYLFIKIYKTLAYNFEHEGGGKLNQ